MTKAEIQTVVQMAESNHLPHALAFEAADILREAKNHGYKKMLTAKATAALVRYQAMQLNGEWDLQELTQTLAWLKPVLMID